MSKVTHIIEVIWHGVDLPSLIGPFDSEDEANRFGVLNIPNGTWLVRSLTYPYMSAGADQ